MIIKTKNGRNDLSLGLALQEYSFEIDYKPRLQHAKADAYLASVVVFPKMNHFH